MRELFESDGTDGTVTTSSRIRKWFLTSFRNYRLVSTRRLPRENAFGEIYYRDSWVLTRDAGSDSSEHD